MPANSIAALLQVPGVAAVQKDTLQQPLDDNTAFIGATTVWPSLGGSDHAGSNVVVGVIDTGVWPEHPMFADRACPAPAGGLKACQFGDGTDVAHLGADVRLQQQADRRVRVHADLHGRHRRRTASEFCNNTTGHVLGPRLRGSRHAHDVDRRRRLRRLGRALRRRPRPGLRHRTGRARDRCTASASSQGCFSSDSVAAVQQAIADGVNVINFSISGGAQSVHRPGRARVPRRDRTPGISVNASAGNSGPGAGTSDHGGPWVTTVGASTGPRSFTSTLHLTADGGATLDVPGVTLTNGISSRDAGRPGREHSRARTRSASRRCAAGTATGKIVVCQRGINGRIDKGRRVLAGGAAGMILYNPASSDRPRDGQPLPAGDPVDGPTDRARSTFVTGHTNVKATWAQGTATPAQADVMASFSSRGPTGDWIKPDVTAPGVQVLAGMTPQPDQTTADNGPPGNLFQAIAGTSMSSPHAAGVSALVKAAHPTWTPEEIKSALMTSSVQTRRQGGRRHPGRRRSTTAQARSAPTVR